MLFCGFRLNEVLKLKISDIQGDIIIIKNGKGQQDREHPMSNNIKRLLDSYLKEKLAIGNRSIWVFSNHNSNCRIEEKGFTRILKKIVKKSKILFTAKVLRTTYCCQLVKNNLHVYKNMKLMGHKNLQSTLYYYSVCNEHLKRDVDSINFYQ